MKRHLFLLGSFMATSLVAANTLLVIGCKKKPSTVKENKEDEKTTGTVELEISNKVKTEIRNIIDDVITNPDDESVDWIIKLDDSSFDNSKDIIDSLNAKIEEIKDKTGKDGEIDLDHINNLSSNFIDKIKAKYASLRNEVIQRINNKKEEFGISNFDFVFDLESIKPILTNLNGPQLIDAITKLRKKPTWYDLNTKNGDEEKIDKIKAIDLFKIKTNLNYNFNFGSTKYDDFYNDAELLITGNVVDYKVLNRYTQDTITSIFTNSKEIKDVLIYANPSEEARSKVIQEYDYIGKQMDWDFSKQPVKDEISGMQFNKLEKLKKKSSESELKDILNGMELDKDNFEFEIEPSKYMKFDNNELNLGRKNEDCILFADADTVGSTAASKKIETQFFSDNSNPKKWTGGKINHKFIEQVKKDGEGEHPRITLSDYYGLDDSHDGDDEMLDMLIGYGKTTIRKASYSGIRLAKITVDTNLLASYSNGLVYLYEDFIKYVTTTISAILNEESTGVGLRVLKRSSDSLFFAQWRFGGTGEWDIIQQWLDDPNNNDKSISFDWIMNNVLYKKRILENPKYKSAIPSDAKDALDPKDETTFKIPITTLKDVNQIKYVLSDESGKYLYARDFHGVPLKIYIKYGPFVVYLAGNDLRAVWEEKNTGISPIWEGVA